MNKNFEYSAFPATVGTIVIGMNAAIAVDQVAWPNLDKPNYVVPYISSSYSPIIEHSVLLDPFTTSTNFASEIADFYATLSEGQEPLGVEFEAVWDANVDNLYEA